MDHAFGEDGERDLADHFLAESGAQALVLALEDAEDHGFEKDFFVGKAAVNGAGGEAGVGGDAGDSSSLDAVLAEDFGGGLEELALGLAAAGLLGLEGEGFGFCGGFGARFSLARGGIFHRFFLYAGRGRWERRDAAGGAAGNARRLNWDLCWSRGRVGCGFSKWDGTVRSVMSAEPNWMDVWGAGSHVFCYGVNLACAGFCGLTSARL